MSLSLIHILSDENCSIIDVQYNGYPVFNFHLLLPAPERRFRNAQETAPGKGGCLYWPVRSGKYGDTQPGCHNTLAFLGLILLLLAGFEGSLLHKLSAAFILYPFIGSLNYLISALMLPLLPSVYTQANRYQFMGFGVFRSIITCLFWFFMSRIFAERLRYVKEYLNAGTLILLALSLIHI